MPQDSLAVEVWQHTSTTAHSTVVPPDGCRDLIWHALPGQKPQWFVTALADSTCTVPGIVGERYCGFRMQAGVMLDEVRLFALLGTKSVYEPQDALPLLLDCMHQDARLTDALDSLAHHATVATAAKQLGVSESTLQRLVQVCTGRSPIYWKRLARVRRAALDLRRLSSLADCAAAHGYTDQAHMAHEFKRWLGAAPSAVIAQPQLLDALAASGYG
jgi:AraC-like DNA-binding protein